MVKTAISVSDLTFERASKRAASLGMSRSEFFSRAAERYLADLDQQSLVGRIDEAIESAGGEVGGGDDAVQAGRRTLEAVDDAW